MTAGLPAVRLRLLHLERTGVLGGRMVRDKYGNGMSCFPSGYSVVGGRLKSQWHWSVERWHECNLLFPA